MFTNFNSLPNVNFAVSHEEVSDKFWGERPTRRTLFREFDKAAVGDDSVTQLSLNAINMMTGPVKSNFSPTKKNKRKKRGITLNNHASSKYRVGGKSKEYRIRNSLYSSKNNI